jgi:hypothetical protein
MKLLEVMIVYVVEYTYTRGAVKVHFAKPHACSRQVVIDVKGG